MKKTTTGSLEIPQRSWRSSEQSIRYVYILLIIITKDQSEGDEIKWSSKEEPADYCYLNLGDSLRRLPPDAWVFILLSTSHVENVIFMKKVYSSLSFICMYSRKATCLHSVRSYSFPQWESSLLPWKEAKYIGGKCRSGVVKGMTPLANYQRESFPPVITATNYDFLS